MTDLVNPRILGATAEDRVELRDRGVVRPQHGIEQRTERDRIEDVVAEARGRLGGDASCRGSRGAAGPSGLPGISMNSGISPMSSSACFPRSSRNSANLP